MAEAASNGPPGAAGEGDNLAAWMAVIASSLGALIALGDVSIVNSSLPVVQGEIGATPSEGTWIGTAYLIAEIIIIPLSAWAERLFGMRRMLIGASLLFALFSMICGLSSSLEMILVGRFGQGLSGGALIPVAMAMPGRRLPPSQAAAGLSVAVMAMLVGPAIGPMVGGWLTENFSWHAIFFINLPIAAIQLAMLTFAMPHENGDLDELKQADWFGIAGIAIGLGAVTTLLEEGHREQWFDSPLIRSLALVGLLGFALVGWGQRESRTGRRPVIRLSLLRNPTMAAVVSLSGVMGVLFYTIIYLIPQFLATVAGYNSAQAGLVTFIGGATAIPCAFLYLAVSPHVDVRLLIFFAMTMLTATCLLPADLTPFSTGGVFVVPQMTMALGSTFTGMPLQQIVLAAVKPGEQAEATSLFSVARNVGGSIGLAATASYQDQRFDVHSWNLHSALSANDPAVWQSLQANAQMLGGSEAAGTAPYLMLDATVRIQALVMTFNDLFLLLGIATMAVMPMILLLRLPKGGPTATMGMH